VDRQHPEVLRLSQNVAQRSIWYLASLADYRKQQQQQQQQQQQPNLLLNGERNK
jgi:hypothetical protein